MSKAMIDLIQVLIQSEVGHAIAKAAGDERNDWAKLIMETKRRLCELIDEASEA